MRIENITSAKNPKIALLHNLINKSRLRREKGLFVVEGCREILHCLDSGFVADTLFVCEEIISETKLNEIKSSAEKSNPQISVVVVPAFLYDKIAYRGGTEGAICEFVYTQKSLSDISLRENPLIVVLEAVEKPGNLGAVLRSADASGADAVVICDPLTDLYNPNLIRSSIGAVFTTKVVTATSEDTINWLKANKIKILTAQLQDSSPYFDIDMLGATAIVMGTESTGLTDTWRKNADAHIMIPMLGRLDSLNVSVSAAILLYEAVRQREISNKNILNVKS